MAAGKGRRRTKGSGADVVVLPTAAGALPGVDPALVAALLEAAKKDPQGVLQQLFGLAQDAAHLFPPSRLTVPDPPERPLHVRVRVDLAGARPPVWRRVELAGDLTLDAVHAVLQEAMGWTDSHLHGFRPPGSRDRFLTAFDLEEGDEGLAEADVRLDQVLRAVGDRLEYEYDFGDGWTHHLRVEAVRDLRDGDRPAAVLAGRGACPPEDVGGIHTYNDLAAALRGTPGAEPASPEVLDWLPEGFDPDAFDLVEHQDAVARAFEPRGDLPAGVSRDVLDLLALADPAAGSLILDLVARARSRPAPDEAVTQTVRPWELLLDLVGTDGIALTQAGYLPPRVVKELFDGLGLDARWIGKGNREDYTYPVAELRHGARDLGLVKVQRGRLSATRKGLALKASPGALRAHVVASLPLGTADADRHGGTAVLLVAAAGERLDGSGRQTAARVLSGCGWTVSGHPVTEWQVRQFAGRTLAVLRHVPAAAVQSLAAESLGL